ncbi:helix-turn-helix domain-containing protein [Halpernia sp.]|uniref:helix-turn-helix domain-containing protein n=1 Tax=Halpernia sp. TaxID=2782209 RepID=UPI003A9539DA
MKENKSDKKRPNYRQPDFSQKKQKKNKSLELYDDSDLSQLFKVTARTLKRWRDEKILPFKKIGGKIYYLVHEVREMIEGGTK